MRRDGRMADRIRPVPPQPFPAEGTVRGCARWRPSTSVSISGRSSRTTDRASWRAAWHLVSALVPEHGAGPRPLGLEGVHPAPVRCSDRRGLRLQAAGDDQISLVPRARRPCVAGRAGLDRQSHDRADRQPCLRLAGAYLFTGNHDWNDPRFRFFWPGHDRRQRVDHGRLPHRAGDGHPLRPCRCWHELPRGSARGTGVRRRVEDEGAEAVASLREGSTPAQGALAA